MDRELLEACWRVQGGSDSVFRCGIFLTMPNLLQVAVIRGDGREASLVFSHTVNDIDVARKLAECCRHMVLAKATFNELLH